LHKHYTYKEFQYHLLIATYHIESMEDYQFPIANEITDFQLENESENDDEEDDYEINDCLEAERSSE